MTARQGSVLNPRFPAPVNTYNPTVHALVDAIFDAMSDIVPGNARAPTAAAAVPSLSAAAAPRPARATCSTRSLPAAPARAPSKDGVSGITVNQSNAKIAPIEIIESEFPTRVAALRADRGFRRRRRIPRRPGHPARISQSRRCALLDPLDAHVIAPNGCAGGRSGRPGDILVNPGSDAGSACRRAMPTIPCRRAIRSASIPPAAAATATRFARDPERVLADLRDG